MKRGSITNRSMDRYAGIPLPLLNLLLWTVRPMAGGGGR
jgi:hypothetical protein